MRKLVIYSPIQLYGAHHGGSELRVLGYTANLDLYVKDFCYCGPDKPWNMPDKYYIQFRISTQWRKLILLCNIVYHYFHIPLYGCRWVIKRFSGIQKLINLTRNGELLYVHQDCTVAEYLRIVEHVPYVYDIHGFFDVQREYFGLQSGVRKYMMYMYLWQEKMVLSLCDYINVESVEMQEYVCRRFHPMGKVLLAPDGIPADLSIYQTQKPIRRSRPYILFSGSYKPMGGVVDLMNIYVHSERLQELADLIVIGDGPKRAVEQVKKLQLQAPEHIVLISPVEHTKLIAYMKGAQVIVCPDREDNIYNQICPHIKLYDALATGRPVVATDLSVNRHIIPEHYPIHYFSEQGEKTMELALIEAVGLAAWDDKNSLLQLTYAYQMKRYWNDNKKELLDDETNAESYG